VGCGGYRLSQETPKPRHKMAQGGTIRPDRPDATWGIDLTCAQAEEGQAAVCAVVDLFKAEF